MLCLCLTLLLSGCGTKTLIKTDIKQVKIPLALLTLPELGRPQVNSVVDISNAYVDLYEHYRQCEINLKKIKELQEN